jgi:hypothetical protein
MTEVEIRVALELREVLNGITEAVRKAEDGLSVNCDHPSSHVRQTYGSNTGNYDGCQICGHWWKTDEVHTVP